MADHDRTLAPASTPSEGTSHSECPYVTGTVTRYCTLTPLTLTDEERDAIDQAIECCEDITYGSPDEPEAAATLRGLLERTQLSGERG